MKKCIINVKPSQSFIDLASRPTQYGDTYPTNKPYIKMSRASSKYSRYHVGKPVTFQKKENDRILAIMNYNIIVKNISIENPLKFHDVIISIIEPDGQQKKISCEDESCYTNLNDKAFRIFIAQRVQQIEVRMSFQKEELIQSKLPIKLLPSFCFEYFNKQRDGLVHVVMDMEEAYILESPF